jgi:hypothetical protein
LFFFLQYSQSVFGKVGNFYMFNVKRRSNRKCSSYIQFAKYVLLPWGISDNIKAIRCEQYCVFFLAKAVTLIYYKLKKLQNKLPSHPLSGLRRKLNHHNTPDSNLYNLEVPSKISATTLVFDLRYVVLHCLAEGLYLITNKSFLSL